MDVLMLSLFKKKNMKLALQACQQHNVKLGLGQELTPEMFNNVIQTDLFIDIDRKFTQLGLTNNGGLAWYCSQIVSTVTQNIENKVNVSSDMYELADKMASVSLLLANSIHSLKLNKLDLQAILNTADVANRWLECTNESTMSLFTEGNN
jgi:hypothetical protein